MMKTMFGPLVPCLLWGGLAIASATPANALAESVQTGNIVNIAANYEAKIFESCNGYFSYSQTIRFLTGACNLGTCRDFGDLNGANVDSVYPVGRRQVMALDGCQPGRSLYELTSCAC
jgi:hypothetical protein